jgi:hypothetical protein
MITLPVPWEKPYIVEGKFCNRIVTIEPIPRTIPPKRVALGKRQDVAAVQRADLMFPMDRFSH